MDRGKFGAMLVLETALPLTETSAVVLGLSLVLAAAWLYYFLR